MCGSTIIHFGTVQTQVLVLTSGVKSQPPALTPLFTAFPHISGLSPLSAAFNFDKGGVGSSASSSGATLRSFTLTGAKGPLAAKPLPFSSLPFTPSAVEGLLPLSLQPAEHSRPLFSIAYSLFWQTPRGATPLVFHSPLLAAGKFQIGTHKSPRNAPVAPAEPWTPFHLVGQLVRQCPAIYLSEENLLQCPPRRRSQFSLVAGTSPA